MRLIRASKHGHLLMVASADTKQALTPNRGSAERGAAGAKVSAAGVA